MSQAKNEIKMFIIDEDFDRGALRSFAFGRNTRPLLAIQRIMQALLRLSCSLTSDLNFAILKITRIYYSCLRGPAWFAIVKIIWR